MSDIKQDGAETAIGNIWTIPSTKSETEDISRTQQAILKTSYALRTSRSQVTQRDFTDTLD